MNFGLLKDLTAKKEKIVVGLDVGTTKTCVIVGEVTGQSGGVHIIGAGMSSSRGIKKGAISNIEHTAESVREAVEQAETSAGVDIKAVHAGISGGHIGSILSNGVIAVKEREIGQKEVDNVIDAARAVAMPFDREMLHVIPVGFTVNGQNGITDPRGMGGIRLETKVQIITCAATAIQNLIRSCQKAGLEVIDVVFQPIASTEALTTQDEKDLGVAVIDIGGGTTDIALFHEGNICHASVLPIGGSYFTNDLAIGLRIPTGEAESLKKRHGCSMLSLIKEDEEVEVMHSDGKVGRKIPRRYMVEIIQPRAEELFSLIKEEIIGKGFHKDMNSGVVLTGGAGLMEGMDVMAENMLELPVRTGEVSGVSGLADVRDRSLYSAGIGLALYGAEEDFCEHASGSANLFSGITEKMRGWFGGRL